MNHVHHTFYIHNRFPWDIDSSALQTLCKSCHEGLHASKDIPIKVVNEDGSLTIFSTLNYGCNRCNWQGRFPQFTHIESGICFSCWGRTSRNNTFVKPLKQLSKATNYNVEFERNRYRKFLLDKDSNI